MKLELYLDIINAVISTLILIMLLYIIWCMIKKQDIVRSIMFLKGDRLKKPTIIISVGIIFFVLRESYTAAGLIGINISGFLVELLEMATVIMIFVGIFIIFKLFCRNINYIS
ncbi:MAG: hypothetical protein O8C61_07920 [Candidatus Methanoperedens sp.]|nr:hypothetical protein [Candidatus Methanoperedens sp.]